MGSAAGGRGLVAVVDRVGHIPAGRGAFDDHDVLAGVGNGGRGVGVGQFLFVGADVVAVSPVACVSRCLSVKVVTLNPLEKTLSSYCWMAARPFTGGRFGGISTASSV